MRKLHFSGHGPVIPIGTNGDYKVFNKFDGLYHHKDGSLEENDGTVVSGANNYSYDASKPLGNKYSKSLKKEKNLSEHHSEEATTTSKDESYPYGYIKAPKTEPY